MAESVQYVMESMVPELEELQHRGLFNAQEIKDMIKERTNFEYKLKRRVSKKEDYLRYIAYELNLEAMLAARRKKLGATGKKRGKKDMASDYAIIRHIHTLFRRALLKFKGDIHLWLSYIEFCMKQHSHKALSDIFARAIQLHPLHDGLWILAAAWEYNERKNVVAARTLFQRALRMCPESKLLWQEYFRMELYFSETLKKASKASDVNEEHVLLSGALPLAVFNNAIQQHREFEFYVSFIDIYSSSQQLFPTVFESLYQRLKEDFSSLPKARVCFAKKHLIGHSISDDQFLIELKHVLKELNDALLELPSQDMMQCIVEFLMDIMKTLPSASDPCDAELRLLLQQRIDQVYESARQQGLMSEAMYLAWMRSSCTENVEPKLWMAIVQDAVSTFPKSGSLWCKKLELEIRSLSSSPCTTRATTDKAAHSIVALVNQTLSEALRHVSKSESVPILKSYFSWLLSSDVPEATKIDAFMKYWNYPERPDCYILLNMFLDWSFETLHDKSIQSIYENVIKSSSQESDFFLAFAKQYMKHPTQNARTIRKLFDRALSYKSTSEDIWLAYIRFELSLKNLAGAYQLYLKASKSVKDSHELMLQYQKLSQSI